MNLKAINKAVKDKLLLMRHQLMVTNHMMYSQVWVIYHE
jgi:hypothetical protein